MQLNYDNSHFNAVYLNYSPSNKILIMIKYLAYILGKVSRYRLIIPNLGKF